MNSISRAATLALSALASVSALMRAGYQMLAILVSPASLGWTPSRRSALASKPVYWSTTQMGDAVELSFSAQGGMALFRSWTLAL